MCPGLAPCRPLDDLGGRGEGARDTVKPVSDCAADSQTLTAGFTSNLTGPLHARTLSFQTSPTCPHALFYVQLNAKSRSGGRGGLRIRVNSMTLTVTSYIAWG